LAVSGALEHNFKRVGQIILRAKLEDEEKILNMAADFDLEDISHSDEEDEADGLKNFEVLVGIRDLYELTNRLTAGGYAIVDSGIICLPLSRVKVPAAIAAKNEKLLEVLQELDDVTGIYCNMDDDCD
jgi:transcriptional/translational regulatory protein YebC/TACO1